MFFIILLILNAISNPAGNYVLLAVRQESLAKRTENPNVDVRCMSNRMPEGTYA
jgi:hypothetical protein